LDDSESTSGTDPLGGSEARSVDELIDEHISDERLDESSFGNDDPLAGMRDDLSATDEESANALDATGEESDALGVEEDAGDGESLEEDELFDTTDPRAASDQTEQADAERATGVGNEDDDSTDDELAPGDTPDDEDPQTETVLGDDEDEDEDSGVLGRIGSIFR
jgi:hypothetical protein